MHLGDLCPKDTGGAARGLPKTPTNNELEKRTWLSQGCFDHATGALAPCTDANAATDWTKFHPWRAPGNAPVYDSVSIWATMLLELIVFCPDISDSRHCCPQCGVAGASPSNNSNAAGGWGFPTGKPQGFPGSSLPPLSGIPETAWKLGSSAEVAWVPVANHGGDDSSIQNDEYSTENGDSSLEK